MTSPDRRFSPCGTRDLLGYEVFGFMAACFALLLLCASSLAWVLHQSDIKRSILGIGGFIGLFYLALVFASLAGGLSLPDALSLGVMGYP